MEFAPKFKALDVSQLKKGRNWDRQIAADTTFTVKRFVQALGGDGRPLPPLDEYDLRSPEGRTLRQFYQLDENTPILADDRAVDRHYNRKASFYRSLADQIQAKKDYKVVPRLLNFLEGGTFGNRRSITAAVMQMGITELYLSLCEPDRFLVGVKDGTAIRKRIRIPNVNSQYGGNIIPTAVLYMNILDKIGRREAELAPEMPFHPDSAQQIVLPVLEKPIEDSLEEAYFKPRYHVDAEGSEVRFRKAGDLTRMILMESGNTLLAKVVTSYGDAAVFINLEDASFGGVDRGYTNNPEAFNPRFARIVADTYKDLVTADEISRVGSGLKALGSGIIVPWSKGEVEDPQVIYIPRKRIVNKPEPSQEDDRRPYDGPPRVKPHRVSPHRKRGNLTDKHREKLYEFERQHGLKKGRIVDNLPSGYTYVRTHFSPAESGEYVKYLPIYIKRRIGEEFARKLQDPINLE